MSPSGSSVADVGDRHRLIIAFAVLLMAFRYVAAALDHLLEGGLAEHLDRIGAGFAILAVLLVLPIMAWKIRHRGREDFGSYFGLDGFVAQSLTRAQVASWATTLILLMSLEVVSDDLGPLPTEFYLQLPLAVMLLVLAGVFFFLNRSGPHDEGEASVA